MENPVVYGCKRPANMAFALFTDTHSTGADLGEARRVQCRVVLGLSPSRSLGGVLAFEVNFCVLALVFGVSCTFALPLAWGWGTPPTDGPKRYGPAAAMETATAHRKKGFAQSESVIRHLALGTLS